MEGSLHSHRHGHWMLSEARFLTHVHDHEAGNLRFNRLHHHAPEGHAGYTDEDFLTMFPSYTDDVEYLERPDA